MFLSIILPVFLCFIPLIVGFLVFSLKFRTRAAHFVVAMLLGLVAVLPISIIQFFLPEISLFGTSPILRSILKSILLYGLVEELLKSIFMLPIPKKEKSALEFLILAFTFGLTLGCFESVVYYLDHLQLATSRGATLLYGSIFVRIFSSDIIHMCCAGLGGLFIFSIVKKQTKVSCLICAILIHGFYDFFAGFQNGLKWFAIFAVLLAIVECRIKYQVLVEEN